MSIRAATPADAAGIAQIYNYYTRNTIITFEETPVSEGDIAGRIQQVLAAGRPWLVALQGGTTMGFAYAGEWKGRCAYRHTVEITIYLAQDAAGRGWGTRLYAALFAELRRSPVHVAIAGIALPNPASIALHEKFGMEKVAHFPEVGYKFGQWIDVGYWQVIMREGVGTGLERE